MNISFKQWYFQHHARISVLLVSANCVPYCVLGALFFINIAIMWPGQMSPDSYTQYKAALSGIFDDHHPPMMSLLWGFLDSIYKGPGLLFLLHLGLLYSACVIFIQSSENRAIKLFYSFFPFIPHVLFYSSMLWKDVGLAFSFLFAIAVVNYFISVKKKITASAIIAIAIAIFYGAAVKFQGQYVAPIVIFGVWYCLDEYTISYKTIIKAIGSGWIFLYSLHSFNDFFVPPLQKAHSWQCVKIYDLAAMSLYTQQPSFPSFLTRSSNFSMEMIKRRFNHKRVDDLFMPPENPLRLCKNEGERTELLAYWQMVVWHHLPLYLKHRFANWWTMVTNMPLQRFETMDFSQFGGMNWFVTLQKASQESPVTIRDTLMHYAGKCLWAFLYLLRYCFKFVFLLPFMIFYFLFGLIYFKRYGQGMSLILINGLSLWFLGILFFCSMASDMRYAYIAACMTHASHGIALGMWRSKKMGSGAGV